MNTEVLWKSESKEDFLSDLKSFARGLDFYNIRLDVENDRGKFVLIEEGKYEILDVNIDGAFKCPNCGADEFSVLEGDFQGQPALGLACMGCETYGAVFPRGM